MEYLIKNGAPRCIQEIKDDLYKIRNLQDFAYSESGQDRGQGGMKKLINEILVRDKARAVCELLSDVEKLQQEREFAKKMREKFSGISSTSQSQSAAPASGKYGGFGSKDVPPSYTGASIGGTGYDPYVNKAPPKEEPPKKAKKPRVESSSDSSDDNDSDSSDSESEKKKKKKKSAGLAIPNKSDRTIQPTASAAPQVAPS